MIILFILLFVGIIDAQHFPSGGPDRHSSPHHMHTNTGLAIVATLHDLQSGRVPTSSQVIRFSQDDDDVIDDATRQQTVNINALPPTTRAAWYARFPRPNYKLKVVVPFFLCIAGGIGVLIWELCF